MNEILDDMMQPTWLPFSVIAARLLVAAFFGAVIGFEREWRNHSAGLRTHVLVSLAAATFAILGLEIVQGAQFEEDSSQFDSLRLIEAVTAGVAFLAAGSIIFARGQVKGLTTAPDSGSPVPSGWRAGSGCGRSRHSRPLWRSSCSPASARSRGALPGIPTRTSHQAPADAARLPGEPRTGIAPGMEELFAHPAFKRFALQDRKRLPARFFARVSGSLTVRTH